MKAGATPEERALLRREVVTAVGLAAAATLTRPRLALSQPVFEKIRVASPVTEPITALYYAIKTKAFERAGLDVEIVPASSGAAATTAVIAGTYEIAKPTLGKSGVDLHAGFGLFDRRPVAEIAPA